MVEFGRHKGLFSIVFAYLILIYNIII